MNYSKNNQKAFTLVELSIVLVIISLIVGGVLVGQNLIKSAEINAFIRDIEKFSKATIAFQNQYNQLPGDMDNAYDYFGTDCASTSGLCNGGGDGTISPQETYRAWKHLDLSKYILSGVSKPTSSHGNLGTCLIGTRLPATAIASASAIYSFDLGASYTNSTTEARTELVPIPGQMLVFGKIASQTCSLTTCSCANLGILTSKQLYEIDYKIDDGFAFNGMVLNSENTSGCSTSIATNDSGEYDFQNSGVNLCRLFYRLKVS